LKAAVDKVLQQDLHITWREGTISDSFCVTWILTSRLTECCLYICCLLTVMFNSIHTHDGNVTSQIEHRKHKIKNKKLLFFLSSCIYLFNFIFLYYSVLCVVRTREVFWYLMYVAFQRANTAIRGHVVA
jgi:hypothetical protein